MLSKWNVQILVNGTNVMSWKQLNCNDPREQLCIFPPYYYLVCPSYLKNKQRYLSVAGKVGAVCTVVWLFLFCAWDLLSYGNDISLCTKHAPFLMLYCRSVNTEPECSCNIVWSIADTLQLHKNIRRLIASCLIACCKTGCPVDSRR